MPARMEAKSSETVDLETDECRASSQTTRHLQPNTTPEPVNKQSDVLILEDYDDSQLLSPENAIQNLQSNDTIDPSSPFESKSTFGMPKQKASKLVPEPKTIANKGENDVSFRDTSFSTRFDERSTQKNPACEKEFEDVVLNLHRLGHPGRDVIVSELRRRGLVFRDLATRVQSVIKRCKL